MIGVPSTIRTETRVPVAVGIPRPSNQGGGLDPAAAAFLARAPTQTASRRTLINDTIKALKTANVWDVLTCLYLPGYNGISVYNWKQALYDLQAVNSPVITEGVSFACDGVSSYFDTAFNPSTAPANPYTQDSAHIGLKMLANYQESVGSVNANSGEANRSAAIFCRTTANATAIRVNQAASTTTANSSQPNGVGYHIASRTASNVVLPYLDGVLRAISSGAGQVSTPMPNANFLVGARNAGGWLYVPTVFSALHIGGGLTDAQAASITSIVNSYLTQIVLTS